MKKDMKVNEMQVEVTRNHLVSSNDTIPQHPVVTRSIRTSSFVAF